MTREEAIETIKKVLPMSKTLEDAFYTLHPELHESEDERIRKALVWHLKADADFVSNGVTKAECIAYLEKQKEQKPEGWSEVELEFRGEKVKVKRPFFYDDKGRGYSTTKQDDDVAWYALRAWCEKKGVSLYDLIRRGVG